MGESDCDRVIERNHRRVAKAYECRVKVGDLCPVGLLDGLGVQVQRCDRRLELVGARPLQPYGAPEREESFADATLVPERALLVVESEVPSFAAYASSATSIVQQHQREEAPHV